MPAQRKSKICNRCGAEAPLNASTCRKCGSARFAPKWVFAKRPINRQVSVEVTETSEKFGDIQRRITLAKWWPGGRANFHIPNVGQWNEIEKVINGDLGPFIGWKAKASLVESIAEKKKTEGKADKGTLKTLVTQHPDFLRDAVQALDVSKLSKSDTAELVRVMQELTNAMQGLDEGFKAAFLNVVKKLPAQGKRALEELEALLNDWSLRQVTTVTQQVRSRLETIELFKERITDPKTYEIRGDNSIHRILENAMWLVDERYWLMHSNRQLLTSIGDALVKKDAKKYGKQRPDFVCGTVGERLIILEIKRPDHKLDVDDLNQLETYSVLAEDYLKFNAFEGYLVGSKRDADLMRYVKRRRNLDVWAYSELVDRTEQRYREFLKG